MRRRLASTASVLLLLLATAGCSGGSDDPPGTEVPELSVQLARVDAAVHDHDWAEARRALKDLLERATSAQRTGDISDEEAARIHDAVRELLARITAPKPKPTATATATPTPTPTSSAPPHTTAPRPHRSPKQSPKHAPAKTKPHKAKHHGKGKKH